MGEWMDCRPLATTTTSSGANRFGAYTYDGASRVGRLRKSPSRGSARGYKPQLEPVEYS